jgi:DNA-directed RNA polymerase specialized sigma24 family protein
LRLEPDNPAKKTDQRSRLSALGTLWQSIHVCLQNPNTNARAPGLSSGCESGIMRVGRALRQEGKVAMANENSVTGWLEGVKAGDAAAIAQLWDRYFERLVRLARGKLPGQFRRAFDEEDVAISAFQSFCERASRGRFPKLNDRNDLWVLLLTLTTRKAVLTIRHQTRRKRGGGRVLGESALIGDEATMNGLASVVQREPSPEDVVRFTDNLERLLGRLEDSILKKVALRRLEGYDVQEIAVELRASTRTIERKLRLIRAIWEQEVSE